MIDITANPYWRHKTFTKVRITDKCLSKGIPVLSSAKASFSENQRSCKNQKYINTTDLLAGMPIPCTSEKAD